MQQYPSVAKKILLLIPDLHELLYQVLDLSTTKLKLFNMGKVKKLLLSPLIIPFIRILEKT